MWPGEGGRGNGRCYGAKAVTHRRGHGGHVDQVDPGGGEAEPGEQRVEGRQLNASHKHPPHGDGKGVAGALAGRVREGQQVGRGGQSVGFRGQQVEQQRQEDNHLQAQLQQACKGSQYWWCSNRDWLAWLRCLWERGAMHRLRRHGGGKPSRASCFAASNNIGLLESQTGWVLSLAALIYRHPRYHQITAIGSSLSTPYQAVPLPLRSLPGRPKSMVSSKTTQLRYACH